jgi:hypothetical protein
MSRRTTVESIMVALGMSFSHWIPGAQLQSLAKALREEAEERRRLKQSRAAASEAPPPRASMPSRDAIRSRSAAD